MGEKITSFQGLRAVAFLAIFVSHAGIAPVSFLGAWGVSIFLCLSGFLMALRYYPNPKKSGGIALAKKKISKLYPLHVVMRMFAAIYGIIALDSSLPDVAIGIIIQTLLIQSWIPISKYYYALNGVAWYLSVCVFIYACFPHVLQFAKNKIRKENIKSYIIGLFLVQVLISALAIAFGNLDWTAPFSTHWVVYICPITRIIDFLIGFCLCMGIRIP